MTTKRMWTVAERFSAALFAPWFSLPADRDSRGEATTHASPDLHPLAAWLFA